MGFGVVVAATQPNVGEGIIIGLAAEGDPQLLALDGRPRAASRGLSLCGVKQTVRGRIDNVESVIKALERHGVQLTFAARGRPPAS